MSRRNQTAPKSAEKTEPDALIVSSSLAGPLRLDVDGEILTVEKGDHMMPVTKALRAQLAEYGDSIRIMATA